VPIIYSTIEVFLPREEPVSESLFQSHSKKENESESGNSDKFSESGEGDGNESDIRI